MIKTFLDISVDFCCESCKFYFSNNNKLLKHFVFSYSRGAVTTERCYCVDCFKNITFSYLPQMDNKTLYYEVEIEK